MQSKKYLGQPKEIVNAIQRNIYGNPRIRKYLRQPPGEESCSRICLFMRKAIFGHLNPAKFDFSTFP